MKITSNSNDNNEIKNENNDNKQQRTSMTSKIILKRFIRFSDLVSIVFKWLYRFNAMSTPSINISIYFDSWVLKEFVFNIDRIVSIVFRPQCKTGGFISIPSVCSEYYKLAHYFPVSVQDQKLYDDGRNRIFQCFL